MIIRNREKTIEIVCQTLNNPLLRKDGIRIMFSRDGWTDVAEFKTLYLYNALYVMAGVENNGMVEIADVDYISEQDYKEAIHSFVVDYFSWNDLLRDVQEFTIMHED